MVNQSIIKHSKGIFCQKCMDFGDFLIFIKNHDVLPCIFALKSFRSTLCRLDRRKGIAGMSVVAGGIGTSLAVFSFGLTGGGTTIFRSC